ncbi:MAG TPA: hypothetical protein VLA95_03310 [Gemmatimonadales bacterium]|nr:hypothetical protein [Gemmatimonadales bacterium]
MRIPTLIVLLVLTACAAEPPGRPAAQAPDGARAGVVDSIFPIEEEIRRFQATLPDTARRLIGGEASREALIARFVRALEQADSAAFAPMAVSRAEFGFLYFPESRFTRKPYRTKPGLLWAQLVNASSRGVNRAFERYGGKPLGFTGFDCPAEPAAEGANRVWEGCTVTIRPAGTDSARTLHLFGSLLERDGVWKFLSFSNDL